MTKKIFRSIVLVAVCALLASLVLVMGCLYDYFAGLQSQALRDELTLAASGVSQGGENYLDTIDSNRYRLTWIAPDGTVLYELRVAQGEMGRVIGKQGRIAKAIRSVMKAAATKAGEKIQVDIVG